MLDLPSAFTIKSLSNHYIFFLLSFPSFLHYPNSSLFLAIDRHSQQPSKCLPNSFQANATYIPEIQVSLSNYPKFLQSSSLPMEPSFLLPWKSKVQVISSSCIIVKKKKKCNVKKNSNISVFSQSIFSKSSLQCIPTHSHASHPTMCYSKY